MGIEPTAKSPEETAFSTMGGAESGASAMPTPSIDTGLASLSAAWPTLPEPIPAGILAMVWAAGTAPNQPLLSDYFVGRFSRRSKDALDSRYPWCR